MPAILYMTKMLLHNKAQIEVTPLSYDNVIPGCNILALYTGVTIIIMQEM